MGTAGDVKSGMTVLFLVNHGWPGGVKHGVALLGEAWLGRHGIA